MKYKVEIFLFIILICYCTVLYAGFEENREILLESIVRANGYPFEKHNVITSDGYILSLHRIPGRKSNNSLVYNFTEYYYSNDAFKPEKYKTAVLLMHGLLGSSADWITTGPNRSLAFMLADFGYDVWLGNNRGNTFSKKHMRFSHNEKKFWNFSWHEFGIYDCPAMIDYILKKTYRRKIIYIGFSQGTTQFYVMNSMLPWYNSKIQLMVGLAPVAFTGNLRGILKPVLMLLDTLRPLTKITGYFEFAPSNPIINAITHAICRKDSITAPLCLIILFVTLGNGYKEVDAEHLNDYLEFIPAGCSTKQMFHFANGVNNPDHFRQYDNGYLRNFFTYGSLSPPEYPLHKVTAPIVHFKGLNDKLAHISDTNLLESKLPNLIGTHTVNLKRLNHFDMLFGLHINTLVYNRIVNLFKILENGNMQ